MSSYGVFSTNLARSFGMSRKFRSKKMADNIRIERPNSDTITAKVITALEEGFARRLLKIEKYRNEFKSNKLQLNILLILISQRGFLLK